MEGGCMPLITFGVALSSVNKQYDKQALNQTMPSNCRLTLTARPDMKNERPQFSRSIYYYDPAFAFPPERR